MADGRWKMENGRWKMVLEGNEKASSMLSSWRLSNHILYVLL